MTMIPTRGERYDQALRDRDYESRRAARWYIIACQVADERDAAIAAESAALERIAELEARVPGAGEAEAASLISDNLISEACRFARERDAARTRVAELEAACAELTERLADQDWQELLAKPPMEKRKARRKGTP
jgi:hypothetical protein